MVGADDARVVTVERLDLDDLRALVGQQHGAVGAGQHLREIDDADPSSAPTSLIRTAGRQARLMR